MNAQHSPAFRHLYLEADQKDRPNTEIVKHFVLSNSPGPLKIEKLNNEVSRTRGVLNIAP